MSAHIITLEEYRQNARAKALAGPPVKQGPDGRVLEIGRPHVPLLDPVAIMLCDAEGTYARADLRGDKSITPEQLRRCAWELYRLSKEWRPYP